MQSAFAVFAALRNFEPALRGPRDQDPNPSLALARPVTPGADMAGRAMRWARATGHLRATQTRCVSQHRENG